jgi:hypothetical protein
MLLEAPTRKVPSQSVFPIEQLQDVLRKELDEAADENVVLHDGWEPVLDWLRVVTIISDLEDIFDFPLPPEKVVKKGGYKSKDEARDNIIENLRRLWDDYHKTGG